MSDWIDERAYGDPDGPAENVVWNCPICGRFVSTMSAPHTACEREIYDEYERELRREVERGY